MPQQEFESHKNNSYHSESSGATETEPGENRPVIHPVVITALGNKIGIGKNSSSDSQETVKAPVSNLLISSPIEGEKKAILYDNLNDMSAVDNANWKNDTFAIEKHVQSNDDVSAEDETIQERNFDDGPIHQAFEVASPLNVSSAHADQVNVTNGTNQDDKLFEGFDLAKITANKKYVDEKMQGLQETVNFENGTSYDVIGTQYADIVEGEKILSEEEKDDSHGIKIITNKVMAKNLETGINSDGHLDEGEEFIIEEDDNPHEIKIIGDDEVMMNHLETEMKINDKDDLKQIDKNENVEAGVSEKYLETKEEPPTSSPAAEIHHFSEEDTHDLDKTRSSYHVLKPKSQSHFSNFTYSPVISVLVGLFLCFCCIRCLRRRSRYNPNQNRGKYSAIGSDDFFNGTFSDDISFNGKYSDDEMSFGSDDGGVNIELGGIHEIESNGGLTLEEING